jgi:hypothetical protein
MTSLDNHWSQEQAPKNAKVVYTGQKRFTEHLGHFQSPSGMSVSGGLRQNVW